MIFTEINEKSSLEEIDKCLIIIDIKLKMSRFKTYSILGFINEKNRLIELKNCLKGGVIFKDYKPKTDKGVIISEEVIITKKQN